MMKAIKYVGVGLGIVALIYCGLPTLLAIIIAIGTTMLSVLVVVVPYGLLITGGLWCLYTVGKGANWMYRKKYPCKNTPQNTPEVQDPPEVAAYKKEIADLAAKIKNFKQNQ